ncbi:hypothetical protein Mal64_31990 [Pseudobythopirellula maris]|uniref:CARDB domain-containing protein n=1 Tax=Pseudobythopirellula maris TaxID=2527991 RepID=A0A5C5ZKS9_9BACT|nr:hypothetical protein [Pseudobythopirellula maris]TWT87657.1 hypothetical protein Mal64_31990 [Pseudobythopirellula maris]
MNVSFMRVLLLAAAVAPLGASASAQGLGPAGYQQLLMGGPRCDHVIDLLMRFGIGGGAGVGPAAGMIAHSPYGPIEMPAVELGDLQIAGVALVASDDPACAPTYAVTIKNCSPRDVCHLQVTLVALLGPIRPHDPTALATVDSIPAGGCVEIAIQLPIESLAMGQGVLGDGCPLAFQKLLVAIDSLDGFAEIDESNNLQLLCRSDIPAQVVVEAPAVEAIGEPADAPAAVQPVEPAPAPETQQGELDSALDAFGVEPTGDDPMGSEIDAMLSQM